jgi:ectoine hydroxylase-related dioxygenase (phytanoyl-CoA dioxygenase family)
MILPEYRLSKEQINRYHEEGYLGPFAICPPEEMKRILQYIDEKVLPQKSDTVHSNPGDTYINPNAQSRHLDHRVMYELSTHPAIIDRMASIFGEDLILWRTNLWEKKPGDRETVWHQDGTYWPIEPVLNISAWLAITEATVENSCMEVIPGSHRKHVPLVKNQNDVGWELVPDPKVVDINKAVKIELKPGEFFLFNERTLHYAGPNRSQKRRLGMAMRVTKPFVRVYSEKLYPGHTCIQVKGEDLFGLNTMGEPPQV